jgi:hypothetical protein
MRSPGAAGAIPAQLAFIPRNPTVPGVGRRALALTRAAFG